MKRTFENMSKKESFCYEDYVKNNKDEFRDCKRRKTTTYEMGEKVMHDILFSFNTMDYNFNNQNLREYKEVILDSKKLLVYKDLPGNMRRLIKDVNEDIYFYQNVKKGHCYYMWFGKIDGETLKTHLQLTRHTIECYFR